MKLSTYNANEASEITGLSAITLSTYNYNHSGDEFPCFSQYLKLDKSIIIVIVKFT